MAIITSASSGVGQGETKRRPSEDDAVHPGSLTGANGDKALGKSPDPPQSSDQPFRKSAPRGSRVNEKEEKTPSNLPPVADALSWPDPKSAAESDDPSRKAHEKADTAEKDSQEGVGSSRKKSWVNFDIVPTVVFNTPLPPRGAKTRGGARGGRELGSARGAHGHTSSVSTPGPGSDRAPAVGGPKTTTSRPRDGSILSRAGSQNQSAMPHMAKRSSVDGVPRDQRKGAIPANAEEAREPGSDSSAVSLTDSVCEVTVSVAYQETDSISSHQLRRGTLRGKGVVMLEGRVSNPAKPYLNRFPRNEPIMFIKKAQNMLGKVYIQRPTTSSTRGVRDALTEGVVAGTVVGEGTMVYLRPIFHPLLSLRMANTPFMFHTHRARIRPLRVRLRILDNIPVPSVSNIEEGATNGPALPQHRDEMAPTEPRSPPSRRRSMTFRLPSSLLMSINLCMTRWFQLSKLRLSIICPSTTSARTHIFASRWIRKDL